MDLHILTYPIIFEVVKSGAIYGSVEIPGILSILNTDIIKCVNPYQYTIIILEIFDITKKMFGK